MAELNCDKSYRGDCKGPVERRYSYNVYAGPLCVFHAQTCFRDQCGLRDEGQGDPRELDEPYYEDE